MENFRNALDSLYANIANFLQKVCLGYFVVLNLYVF